jgi:hypothetical protein
LRAIATDDFHAKLSDVNILFTSVGDFLTLESQVCLKEWKDRQHIVERMPIGRVTAYLRFDLASSLALVDAIVCMADTDSIAFADDNPRYRALDFPVEKALTLAEDVRNLPENVTMRDGRKWRTIPFAIFCGRRESTMIWAYSGQSHAKLYPTTHSPEALRLLQAQVDDYHDQVLRDYQNLGMLVRIDRGRAQIGPALRLKNDESEHYYAPRDLRKLKKDRWVTVKRDSEGLRKDVELFQILLERQANEREMHEFFEEHPAILMEARMGIPLSHAPRFTSPGANTPDFSFAPILGPWDARSIELLELKGPAESALLKGPHPGFSAKVHHAVDQIRDYGRYLRQPDNMEAVLKGLGYIPDDSKLAVLIGRTPKSDEDQEVWAQRQSELNVKVVTYDEILAVQANQLKPTGPYTLRYGSPGYPSLDED